MKWQNLKPPGGPIIPLLLAGILIAAAWRIYSTAPGRAAAHAAVSDKQEVSPAREEPEAESPPGPSLEIDTPAIGPASVAEATPESLSEQIKAIIAAGPADKAVDRLMARFKENVRETRDVWPFLDALPPGDVAESVAELIGRDFGKPAELLEQISTEGGELPEVLKQGLAAYALESLFKEDNKTGIEAADRLAAQGDLTPAAIVMLTSAANTYKVDLRDWLLALKDGERPAQAIILAGVIRQFVEFGGVPEYIDFVKASGLEGSAMREFGTNLGSVGARDNMAQFWDWAEQVKDTPAHERAVHSYLQERISKLPDDLADDFAKAPHHQWFDSELMDAIKRARETTKPELAEALLALAGPEVKAKFAEGNAK